MRPPEFPRTYFPRVLTWPYPPTYILFCKLQCIPSKKHNLAQQATLAILNRTRASRKELKLLEDTMMMVTMSRLLPSSDAVDHLLLQKPWRSVMSLCNLKLQYLQYISTVGDGTDIPWVLVLFGVIHLQNRTLITFIGVQKIHIRCLHPTPPLKPSIG